MSIVELAIAFHLTVSREILEAKRNEKLDPRNKWFIKLYENFKIDFS